MSKAWMLAAVIGMVGCAGESASPVVGPSSVGSGSGRASVQSVSPQSALSTGEGTGTFPQDPGKYNCPSAAPRLKANTNNGKVDFGWLDDGGDIRHYILTVRDDAANGKPVVYQHAIEGHLRFWAVTLPAGRYLAVIVPVFVGCGEGTPSAPAYFSVDAPWSSSEPGPWKPQPGWPYTSYPR